MNWPLEIIKEGKTILTKIDFSKSTPNKEKVLLFLETIPSNIKVVIIGQDPYPTKNVANGNAFAVNKGFNLPQSLQNIFKEIKEIRGHIETDETLEHWQKQGVLLLNASLTTEINKPNAHKELWQEYTQKVITFLDNNFQNVIWILWGKEAEKVAKNIKGHKIIDAHPSPLSFYKRKKNTFKDVTCIDW